MTLRGERAYEPEDLNNSAAIGRQTCHSSLGISTPSLRARRGLALLMRKAAPHPVTGTCRWPGIPALHFSVTAPCCSEIRATVLPHWDLAAQPRTQSVGQKALIINESISSATSQHQERLWHCQSWPVSFHRNRFSEAHRRVADKMHREVKIRCKNVGGWLKHSQMKGYQLLISSHFCSVAEQGIGWKLHSRVDA